MCFVSTGKDFKKFVQVGTVCAYPLKPKTIPFTEDELWDGYPEPTNAPMALLIALATKSASSVGVYVAPPAFSAVASL